MRVTVIVALGFAECVPLLLDCVYTILGEKTK